MKMKKKMFIKFGIVIALFCSNIIFVFTPLQKNTMKISFQVNNTNTQILPNSSDTMGDNWSMFHANPEHNGTIETTPKGNSGPFWSLNITDGNGLGLSRSLTISNGMVYIGSNAGYLYCQNATTGYYVWGYGTNNGIDSTPAVANGKVYVGTYDNILYCLNAMSGTQIWNYTADNWIDSSPTVANGMVYVGCNDYNLYCLNATNGTKIWNYTTGSSIYSSPAVANGSVYFGSEDGNVYCLNANTGAKIWSYTTDGVVSSSPAVANGMVYVGSGDNNTYCLNAVTGAKIWSYTTDGVVSSSPAVANGLVYFGSGDGNVCCLNANTGAKIWSYTTDGVVSSSPAVANGMVYIGSGDSCLYCLNATTGNAAWKFKTIHSIYGWNYAVNSPAIANGMVYVGNENGSVYCLPMYMTPSSPQNVNCVANDGKITISWNAPELNGGSKVIGYKIYQIYAGYYWDESISNYNNTYLTTTAGNVFNFTYSHLLTPNYKYDYKVCAVNKWGDSLFTSIWAEYRIPDRAYFDDGLFYIMLFLGIIAWLGTVIYLIVHIVITKKKKKISQNFS